MVHPAAAIFQILKLVRLAAEGLVATITLGIGARLARLSSPTGTGELDFAGVALSVAILAASTPLAIGHARVLRAAYEPAAERIVLSDVSLKLRVEEHP